MGQSIFTKIINREIPAKILYENDSVIAFNDIHPQAPVHVLVVPKHEIIGLAHASAEDQLLLGAVMLGVVEVAKITGIDKGGYRVIINNGINGGQEVPHLHAHVLGGCQLGRMIEKK